MNLIERLLLKLYLKSQREITNVSEEEYYELLKFKSREDVVKLLKTVMTHQTIHHWESKDDSTKQKMARGASFLCKVLLDAHRMVMLIEEEEDNEEKKKNRWEIFKKKFKIH